MDGQTKAQVSIIIPVRNESRYIGMCLDAIFSLDYPAELLEIICVDGLSDDGTRDIIHAYGIEHPNLTLLDNPSKTVPHAMNIGINHAQGDVIVRIDARCIVEPDYVRQCVFLLEDRKVQNVGGAQRTVGEDPVSTAIALAMASRFGMGNSKFRYASQQQYVDTVYLGAYPKTVLEQIGLFDVTLLRNQDYELNHRLIKSGGKILFSPSIRSLYHGRPTLRKVWKQYFQYGYWKVRVLRKHPDSLKWRQLVAPAFVLSLLVGTIAWLAGYGPAMLVAAVTAYAFALLIATLATLRTSKDYRSALLVPVVFSILHLSWGLGFLWGVATLPFPAERVIGSGY